MKLFSIGTYDCVIGTTFDKETKHYFGLPFMVAFDSKGFGLLFFCFYIEVVK